MKPSTAVKAAASTSLSAVAASVVEPALLKVDPTRWYEEDDIRNLLEASLDDDEQIDVFAQTQMEHTNLLVDNFRTAARRVSDYGIAVLIPIHLHGNHWAAAVVRRQADGNIQVIYNDPLGESLESQPNAANLVAAVQGVNPAARVVDLQLRQQRNGYDCGPFTVDNLLQIARAEGLDNANREEIVKMGILARPENGSAIEIRRDHALLLPHLQIESGSTSHKPKSARDERSYKSDDAFRSDVKKLLLLRQKLAILEAVDDPEEAKSVLVEIGNIAAKVCRKDSDATCIRNKYSSLADGKADLLQLNALERLEMLDEAFESGVITDDFVSAALPKIKADLPKMRSALDYVLTHESTRIAQVFADHDDKEAVFKDLKEVAKVEAMPANINQSSALEVFIATYYLPKCLSRMREVLQSVGSVKWDSLVDRYHFARAFALVGELSRGVRYVVPAGTVQGNFFRDLNHIRNAIKTPKTHAEIFASGIEDGNYAEFERFVAAIPYITENVEFLLREVSTLTREDEACLEELSKVTAQALPKELPVIKEFGKLLKGKNPYSGKLIDCLTRIEVKLRQISSASTGGDFDPTEYNALLAKLTEEEKKALRLPAGNLADIQKWAQTGKIKSARKSPDAIALIRKISDIQKEFTSESVLKKLKEEKEGLLEEYKKEFEAVPDEYRFDSDELEFPEPEWDEIREYLAQREEIKKAEEEKRDPVIKVKKTSTKKFASYCRKYDEESARMAEVLDFETDIDIGGIPAHDEQRVAIRLFVARVEADLRKRKEDAVTHSVGIIGESIRYMLEIDSDDGFLSRLASDDLYRDIDRTRCVRNRQVMHGVFNYDAVEVLRTAQEDALPWRSDVEAIRRVKLYTELLEKDEATLLQELKEHNEKNPDHPLEADYFHVAARFYVGDAYFRLGRYGEARELLEEAKALAAADPDKKFSRDIIAINIMLSALELKSGNRSTAFELLQESQIDLERLNSADNNILYARVLNNMATMLSEDGDFAEARKLYLQSTKLSKGHPVQASAVAQFADIEFNSGNKDRAVMLLNLQAQKELERCGGKVTKDNIFELLMLKRQQYIYLFDEGKIADSEKVFKEYEELCAKTHLLKAVFGASYRRVEAMYLGDLGERLYTSGNFSMAINRWENSLKIMEDLGMNGEEVARVNLQIGNSYKYLALRLKGDHEERFLNREMAVRYFERAKESAVEAGCADTLVVGHANASLAELYLGARNKKSSEECQKEARRIFTRYGEVGNDYCEVMNANLSVIRTNQNPRTAGAVADVAGSDVVADMADMIEAENFMRRNRHKDAIPILEDCRDSMRESGIVNPSYASVLTKLFDCYCSEKKQKNALKIYREIEKLATTNPECVDIEAFVSHANPILQAVFRIGSGSTFADRATKGGAGAGGRER